MAEIKYNWSWILTVTRAPENIQTNYFDGQKIVLSESKEWFDTKSDAIAAASLSHVCDMDYPDSWGLELIITENSKLQIF